MAPMVAAAASGTTSVRDAVRSARRGAIADGLRTRVDFASRCGANRVVERRRRLVARGRAPRRVEARVAQRSSRAVASSLQVSQFRAQLRERVADAALHGFDAGAGERRDFGELEPALLMQQERFALRGRQRRERGGESRADLARAGANFGLVVARAGNRGDRIVVVVVIAGGGRRARRGPSRASDRPAGCARSGRATS